MVKSVETKVWNALVLVTVRAVDQEELPEAVRVKNRHESKIKWPAFQDVRVF